MEFSVFQLVPVALSLSLDFTEKGLLPIKLSKETTTWPIMWFRAVLQ